MGAAPARGFGHGPVEPSSTSKRGRGSATFPRNGRNGGRFRARFAWPGQTRHSSPLARMKYLAPRRWASALALVILTGAGPADAAKKHTVAEGQSLWRIAQRYQVTVAAICEANGVQEDAPLKPGQVLLIPEKGEKIEPPRPPPQAEGERPAESDKDGGSELKTHWVVRKPDPSTQTQKTPAERGGVNPCMTADPGWGAYDSWSREPSMGQMIAPKRSPLTSGGYFDVMFHFHGHEAVRKEWVQAMSRPVLVGIDLGIGSGAYEAAFRSPLAFEQLVASVEKAMAKKYGRKAARVRKIGLSGWSAGYGAVQEILRHEKWLARVDTVVLLDGLHAGYDQGLLSETQLAPFLRFSRLAAAGDRFFFVSHSSIIPPGYASTTETANFLIYKLGGRPRAARPRGADPWGLELISRYNRGSFHVRGFRGNDKMDHCAHIGLYRDVLRVHVRRRWG